MLIVNLGTPDAADAPSVRRYLREFLSDPRVIENQGLVWQFVLNGIILPLAAAHQRPRLRENLEPRAKRIAAQDHHPRAGREARATLDAVDPAHHGRLGDALRQSVDRVALEALAKAGCERILVLPLYPQYSAATTATVCDEVFRALMRMRDQPALRVAPPYYDDPVYIEALASSIEAELQTAAVQARDDPRLVPRHPEILRRRGRSLSAAIAPRRRGCCASGCSSTRAS